MAKVKDKKKRKKEKDPNLFGIVKKGKTQVRVYKSEYGGKLYLHLREFYEDEETGWQPTKKGFTLSSAEQMEKLTEILEKAEVDFF